MSSLKSDALADRYRIERELGAGGMATVYLAHDLKHDRKVALKVLKPELAAVIGAERFLAEIKTTANLQHPHILPLHDSGEVDGTVFYVMPFVEGESLRDRLNREKQLPVDDALRIATEVADALHYAHGHGVIHRDIKPENILLHDGHALVADFGIALAASTTAGTRMTETGMSLGTPTYMSPEQAMGERTLDARTDVYALGCVLYEMLLGEAPFTGPTAQAIVAKVLTEKPAALIGRRGRVPPHVEAAVLNALEKLPADRFASAAQFAQALATPTTATQVAAQPVAPRVSQRALLAGVALVVLAAAAAGWKFGQRGTPAPTGVARYSIALGGSQGLSPNGGSHIGWSRDGRTFVFAAFDGSKSSQLWVRPIDALTATPVLGTDGASDPMFSPDGSQIVFVRTTPFSVNMVPRAGGRSVQIIGGKDISGGGADWSDDNWIYFDGASSLSRVRPDGTGRENLYVLDSLQKEAGLGWPQALPGGRGALFRVRRTGDDLSGYTIDAYDLRSHQHKRVVKASYARYVPSGHLLYVTADGSLMASRFDLNRLELTGTPVTIARGLSIGPFGAADVAISSSGTLLYTAGHGVTSTEPTWLSRDGRASPVDAQLTSIYSSSIALSPDGSQLALHISAPSSSSSASTEDVWVKGLPTGPMSRLTFEGEQNRRPRWSHDGRDLFYVSSRAGPAALYRQRADGTTPAVRVAALDEGIGFGFDSPDGKWLIVQNEETTKDGSIYAMQVGVDSVLKPLVASPFNELNPSLSPDGKWLAYQSDETGRAEVYVRPFPDVGAGKFQVSAAGGSAPRWNHKGDEIFFQTLAQDMVSARVRTTPTFGVVSTTRLFSWLGYFWPYDVSRDDERFLMLRTGTAAGEKEGAAQLIVVENFIAELRRLLP